MKPTIAILGPEDSDFLHFTEALAAASASTETLNDGFWSFPPLTLKTCMSGVKVSDTPVLPSHGAFSPPLVSDENEGLVGVQVERVGVKEGVPGRLLHMGVARALLLFRSGLRRRASHHERNDQEHRESQQLAQLNRDPAHLG